MRNVYCQWLLCAQGDFCGSWCDNYCGPALNNCTGDNAIYADMAECMTHCEAMPADAEPGVTTGDSVQCRAVRGVLKNDIEAEDAAQEAWLAAYRALHTFEGRAAFGTWLTRIAIQRATARYRRGRRTRSLEDFAQPQPEEKGPGPESAAQRSELARVLETAIDRLPASYHMAIVLRDVERMSTVEVLEDGSIEADRTPAE